MGTRPELRSPPGEGPIDGGDRQARAAFGLVAGDPTLRMLVALEALALGGLWLVSFLLRREAGPADRVFEEWTYWALAVGISTIGSFAVTCAVDAKIDGFGGDLRTTFGEVRQRLPVLFCWWLASIGCVAALGFATTAVMQPLPALLVLGLVWGLGSFFVIPVIVLEGGGPLRILGETVRLLRARWGRTLVGLLEIGFVFGIFVIVCGTALRAVADDHTRSTGASILRYGPLLLVFYFAYAWLAATRGSFALILTRDALDDLPGEPAAARPRRRGATIFRRVAFSAFALLIGLVVLAAIFGHHHHR